MLSITKRIRGAALAVTAWAVLSPCSAAAAQPASGTSTTQPATSKIIATVVIPAFRFEGNRVFADQQLAQVLAGYTGRPVTPEDLEEARVALTRYYIERGYVNSGAILPENVTDGAPITVRIVEGTLTEIHLSGNRHLRDSYLESRLRLGSNPALNLPRLRDQLELLRQDPNLMGINAELRPGPSPGTSVLDVRATESTPIQIGTILGNRRPPGVGPVALDVVGSWRNLTGFGDFLSLRYGLANGRLDDLRLAGDRDFSIDYSIPLGPRDTTVMMSFSRSDSVVVEAPFDDLDFQSHSDTYALTLRQPIFRRPLAEAATDAAPARRAMEIALFATAALRNNETTLLGMPFDFTPGGDNGRTRLAVLRLGQELWARGADDAFTLRSTFNIGVGAPGATMESDNIPDGQYVAWLGQAQYVRRVNLGWRSGMDLRDSQLVLRGAAQIASGPLLPSEQFAVGGFDTVRGYRENQLVRDRGVAASAEFHLPIIHKGSGQEILAVVPFFDIGWASDIHGSGDTLSSVGIGMVFTPERRVSLQLFYGYPLLNRSNSRDDLQDIGLHFNLAVYAF